MKSIVSSLLSISFDLEGNELLALDSGRSDQHNNVWTLDGAILYPVGRFPVRMTIVRLSDGPTTTTTTTTTPTTTTTTTTADGQKKSKLVVWSPFPPPSESADARASFMHQIESLGTVAYIVAPNSLHWMGVMPFAQACSNTDEIQVCVAPGLTTKQEAIDAGLKWDFVLSNEIPSEWGDNNNEIQVKYIPGIPQLEEVILYHTPSKTLLIGDMAFHFQRQSDNPKLGVGGFILPCYLYATDGYRPCCLTRTFKWLIRDIEACCQAMEEVVAEYDFECIVMAHGAIVNSQDDAKRILTQGTVSLLQEWRDAAAKRKQQSKMSWPVAFAATVAISSIGLAMILAGKAGARKGLAY